VGPAQHAFRAHHAACRGADRGLPDDPVLPGGAAELEEAAELDNASRFGVFLKIMVPLSMPALTTLGLFTFLYAWNDYLWPLVSATTGEMYTVTVGLASIQGNFAQTGGPGSIMASAVFASLPIVILYLVFQRFIVQGVSMSAGK
jgi:multiple sugar transport system permease protein